MPLPFRPSPASSATLAAAIRLTGAVLPRKPASRSVAKGGFRVVP